MDPLNDPLEPTLDRAHAFSLDHLKQLGAYRAATAPTAREPLPLPDEGAGGLAALDELIARYGAEFSGSPGPRYWGFVNGGVTPAALAGDWLAAAIARMPSSMATARAR